MPFLGGICALAWFRGGVWSGAVGGEQGECGPWGVRTWGVAETAGPGLGRAHGAGCWLDAAGSLGWPGMGGWAMQGRGREALGVTLRPESAEVTGDRGRERGSQGKVPGCE